MTLSDIPHTISSYTQPGITDISRSDLPISTAPPDTSTSTKSVAGVIIGGGLGDNFSKSSGPSTGAIVGAVIGGVVALTLVVVVSHSHSPQ